MIENINLVIKLAKAIGYGDKKIHNLENDEYIFYPYYMIIANNGIKHAGAAREEWAWFNHN